MVKPSGHFAVLPVPMPPPHASRAIASAHSSAFSSSPAPVLLASLGVPTPFPLLDSLPGVSEHNIPYIRGSRPPQATVQYHFVAC